MANQLLRNFSWLTFGYIVVKPIWFVFITYVCIRFLGLQQYGSMTATLGLMAILDGALALGTSSFSIREIARDRLLSSDFFSNFLLFRLLASTLAIGIGLVLEMIIGNQGLLRTALFAGTYVLALNLTEYCRTFYRAHEVFKYDAISTIWEKVLVVGFGTLFLLLNSSAASVLLGMTVGMLATFLTNLRWVVPRFAHFRVSLVRLSFYRTSIPRAIPLGLASIFIVLYFRTDSVMIEAFRGELMTGQYSIAFRIVEALLLFPTLASTVLLPRLSDTYVKMPDRFRTLGTRSAALIFMGSLPLAAGVSLAAPTIVRSMDSSPEAVPAIALMRILIWVFPLAAANGILSTMMVAADMQNRLALALGIAAILNVAANLALIPEYGATGAAYATIATQGVVAIAFLAFVPPRAMLRV